MINLEKTSGLPIELKDDLFVQFNPPMTDREPTYIRDHDEIRKVMKDSQADIPFTYVGYRHLYLPQHKDIVEQNHVQYDLTIVPPIMLGSEFNKTQGHYHANKPGTIVAHPEYYEVLNGHALFLLQKMDEQFKRVLDVIVFEARTGQKIIYPPNYGHIMVNIGKDILVTANWLSTDYKPLYEPMNNHHGMSYYVIKNLDKPYEFTPNTNYADHPPIRSLQPINDPIPMYTSGMANPASLDFLNNPEKYAKLFIECLQKSSN